MKYYSTNKQAPVASLEEAVVKGLAGDKGLYMPEYIDSLDEEVIANMKNQSFHEIACTVAQMFFGEDIEPKVLDGIVKDTLSFETPVVPVKDNIYMCMGSCRPLNGSLYTESRENNGFRFIAK